MDGRYFLESLVDLREDPQLVSRGGKRCDLTFKEKGCVLLSPANTDSPA